MLSITALCAEHAGVKILHVKQPPGSVIMFIMLSSVNECIYNGVCGQDYVMCLKWLPEIPGSIPPNASHQVRTGAHVCVETPARGRGILCKERSC